jgi:hypothetical protein
MVPHKAPVICRRLDSGVADPRIKVLMWSQPYLETCCRSALHRVHLCSEQGRPAGLADDPCLQRLREMGLCHQRDDGRFEITRAGQQRHATEVLRLTVQRTGA